VGLALTLASAVAAATPAFAEHGDSRKGDHRDHQKKHKPLHKHASERGGNPKLDDTLNERAGGGGTSRVIVMLEPGGNINAEAKRLGARLGLSLPLVNGKAMELPNQALRGLAGHPSVLRIVDDRPTSGEMNRVAVTVGARAVQQTYGYRGAGVGVAVIDSGVSSWNNDLTYQGTSSLVRTLAGQRVVGFVDFVNGRSAPYDDNGHGTHVAGIVAGNGFNSLGVRAGIAPDAHLVSLKVLNQDGRGVISNVIAALGWVVANKATYNLRVINLSVGAAVTESYNTDPLTLAAKRAVDAGIVVVTAAGNLGSNTLGEAQYGGITAPGNAPWVLTVGASNHQGTVERSDDVMASYSSRGPSAIDFQAKPDIVAPGTGTVSLSDPTSLMYTTKAAYLLSGSSPLGYMPYLSLSGTSMSAPVVSGSVALMLQANPKLTPNLVKGILQYTAQVYPGYDALTEGAGFLNTKGAVDLARFFRIANPNQTYPHPAEWTRKIIWGNHRIGNGAIKPNAPAWRVGVTWGSPTDAQGLNVVWGTRCNDACDNVVWGTHDSDDNVVWGTASLDPDNVVWGTSADLTCGTADVCDNVVWGTLADDEDNVVWGTDCGGADCPDVIWGSAANEEDNVVWGTASEEDNVVWGTASDEDNVVWGTASDEDNVVWGTSGEDPPLYDDPEAPPACFDRNAFESLFGSVGGSLATDPDGTSPVTSTTVTISGGTGGGL
jgi:serine protease AprX